MRAQKEQVLFLDEAPLPRACTTDVCAPSLRCVAGRACGGWGGDKRTRTQVSMMDVDIFQAIIGVMSTADNARRKGESRGREQFDSFGDAHLLLFGDFKRPP